MSTNDAIFLTSEESRNGLLNVFGDEALVKLSSSDTGGRFAVYVDETPPKQGPPLHRHSREDEFFYVLEGEYLFQEGERQISAQAGDCTSLPRGSAHTFQNVGSGPGRTLIVVQPGGFDGFVQEIATVSAREPDMAVILPIFEKYGLELLGPPLSAGRER